MGFPAYLLGIGIPLFVGLLGIGLYILNQERPQAHYQYRGYERQKQNNFFEDFSETCTICLDPMAEEDSVLLNCGHRLHSFCLVKLNERNLNKCPQCRADIVY